MKFTQFQACFHRNFQEAGNSMPSITAGKIVSKMEFLKISEIRSQDTYFVEPDKHVELIEDTKRYVDI